MTLSWHQVVTWRLSQHSLRNRGGRQNLLDFVAQIGGVHAQLISAAQLALSARVRDLSAADAQKALWVVRTWVKSWMMRGTLHLVTASDFPVYVSALGTLRHFKRPSWLKYHRVTLDELESITEGVRAVLNGSGMPRDEMAEAIADRTGKPELAELLKSGWGALLKPAAFQGCLCHSPNDGKNVTS